VVAHGFSFQLMRNTNKFINQSKISASSWFPMLKRILSISQYPYLKLEADETFADKVATLFKAYGFV